MCIYVWLLIFDKWIEHMYDRIQIRMKSHDQFDNGMPYCRSTLNLTCSFGFSVDMASTKATVRRRFVLAPGSKKSTQARCWTVAIDF
ncbi:hypothetical protein I7I53_05294 [Histoplasma capsulatum var. duboisii H88]|uniref:Uncharacterized protein n=1 Tax=Ajellomyces capsulatus (strain H88) TaxID=544711 RepID=A0A8A1LWK7_AJEC8|nr:hypothetical protein I7I53_05294 [Histoplasma capsulatum var. duboisii H88]